MKEKQRLRVYDTLRQFQKNKVFTLLDRKDLSNWEREALETLSGVLYLVESAFTRPEEAE